MSKDQQIQKEEKAESKDVQLFRELLAESSTTNVPEEGGVIDGTIVAVSKGEVLVDFGGKAEGVVQGRELVDDSTGNELLEVGSPVLAMVLFSEDEEGRAILSIRRARAERKWREMEQKYGDKTSVHVSVVQPNKGGLIVNAEGLQGFVPISQLGPDHYPSSIQKGPGFADAAIAYLTRFVGEEFDAQIIEYERATNRLILSERVLLQRTQGFQPLEELDFKSGDMVKGNVVAIKDFGVFVDLGVTSGLVHISEMSWDRVNHPGDLVKIGDELEVKVIGIEEGGRRVSLSMKRLLDNPWKQVAEKYSMGQTVKGLVTKIIDYGAFVQIEPGFDGLVHISELSSFHVKDPADVLQEGQEYDFKIILLETDEQRLGLSYKQVNPEPFADRLAEEGATPETEEHLFSQTESPDDSIAPLPAPDGETSIFADETESASEPEPQSVVAAPETAPVVIEEIVAPALEIDRDEAINQLKQIEGVGEKVAERLFDAGYQTAQQLCDATISELTLVPGIRKASADKIQQAAQKISG